MLAETLLPLGKLDPGLAAPEVPLDVHSIADQAQQVEQLGYYALVLEETKDDPFALLALAAQHTQSLKLGTSVAIAFARSPFVTAMSAWTLQKISNGRFELGLGSQVRAHMQRRYGIKWHAAGPWMRDYVGAVRAIWASWQNEQPLDYQSERYQLDLSVPLFTPAPIAKPQIPIQVAAVNPYMCRVAGEVADGVRLHPVCDPNYIRDLVLPATAKGRALAAQQRPFEHCLKPLIASAENPDALAIRAEVARQRLAFYLSTPAYRKAFDHAGLGDVARATSQLAREQRWDQMAAQVTDDMLHRWVVVATYDALAETIKKRYSGLIQRIEVSIPLQKPADIEVLQTVVASLNSAQR
jgi:probable F420-dependent oxidoreductase